MTAPDAGSLDADLADARAKLDAAKSASEEAWKDVYPQLVASLGRVRDAIDAAGDREEDERA